jgi:feruloyl esterase
VDQAATARPINFSVALPANWNGRSVQLGGGGMNGTIPGLAGQQLAQGYVTYGSDSGHQMAGFPGGFGKGKGPGPGQGAAKGPAGPNLNDDWTLNDEAIKNLGYMQMKKTTTLVRRRGGARR